MSSSRRSPQAQGEASDRRRRYLVAGQAVEAPALEPGLYVVATPIGNLRDTTLRALEILAACDLIACEDTRVTHKLLDHYGISAPLVPYHDHNAETARPRILEKLAAGGSVALVSDAGTPLISDPGYKLVRAARAEGCPVTAAPGPSAVMTALTVAGLPTDRFFYEGFLPVKETARRTRIAELARIPATLVLFEAGPRIAATLADLAAGLGEREAAVCRELTKLHEEVRRGTLGSLAGAYGSGAETRGEMVVVVGPPAGNVALSAPEVDALLRAALARTSVKDAVAEVAAATGEPRRDIYRRALEFAKEDSDGAPDRA